MAWFCSLMGKKFSFKENNRGNFIISFFITYIIKYIFKDDIKYEDYPLKLFFSLGSYSDERSFDFYNSVVLWLKLYIRERRYVPVLQIEEDFPKFYLSLLIRYSKEYKPPIPFYFFVKEKKKEKIEIMKDLLIFDDFLPEVSKLFNEEGKDEVEIKAEDFAPFLFERFPPIKLLGISLLIPKELANVLKPKKSLKLKIGSKKNIRTWLDLETLLDFEWQIALGENLLDVEEFLNLVSNMRGLVKVKDQFVYIKEEELVKLFEEFKAKPKLHSSQKLQILFSGEYNDAPVLFSEDLLKIIEEWKSSEEIKIPNSLKGNLREHQKRGFGWLYKNYKIGFGSILADDMGLGKTIQVITFLLKLKEEDQLKD